MPLTRYSASPVKYPHSSDTEQLDTPPRKRFLHTTLDDDDERTPGSSTSRKRQRRESPRKQSASTRQEMMDLEKILRECAKGNACQSTFLQLKAISNDETLTRPLIKSLIYSAKRSVSQRCRCSRVQQQQQQRLLETELYMKWLDELGYVATAIENALSAKVAGTRKRLPGLGRSCHIILFNLIDEFIDEVNVHVDGWSHHSSGSSSRLYPPTMSVVEEAKDPSTDSRSEEAVRRAEDVLRTFDLTMANAARRYKTERGCNNPLLADKIGAQEHALARGCCLLSEQTGYGAEDDDAGGSLMEETRNVMTMWKNEYDDCEDQLDSD